MTVALDATMLILLFDEHARAPIDPSTNVPVTNAQERIRHFVNTTTKQKGSRIIIPTPALAEFMVRVKPESAVDYVNQLQRIRGCHIAPFSIQASIEAAEMIRQLLNERPPSKRGEPGTRAKAKFDQQIVAIAKVEGATTIYSDDGGLKSFAQRFGIETLGLVDLPLSPDSAQGTLVLEPPSAKESTSE